jgi:hypothetical protein
MSVTDGQRTVAEFKIAGVTAAQGIGIYQLRFSLEVEIAAMRDEPARILEPRVFVSAGPTHSDSRPLGTGIPETQWFAETNKDPYRSFFTLSLDLSGAQLSALERLRGGSPLYFCLKLHTLVESQRYGVQRGFEQSWLELPASAWAKILKDLGYTEILLVALELPVRDIPTHLRTAVQQLREAHADFIAGRYDQTVGACRLAIDGLHLALRDDADVERAFRAFGTDRRTMTKRERAMLVSGAIRHYTHLAHHLDSAGQLEVFSRQDAQFVLAATSSLIWDAVSALKQQDRM